MRQRVWPRLFAGAGDVGDEIYAYLGGGDEGPVLESTGVGEDTVLESSVGEAPVLESTVVCGRQRCIVADWEMAAGDAIHCAPVETLDIN